MRKFRHKPSGEIFTQKNDLEMIGLKDSESDGFTLPTWLLEQGNDWEEVKEEVKPKGPIFGVSVMKEEPNYLITAFRNKNIINQIFYLKSNGRYNETNSPGGMSLESMLNGFASLEDNTFEIYSVKNSKGEEFTIGDLVMCEKEKFTISHFDIGYTNINIMMAVFNETNTKLNNLNGSNIELISKVKSPIYTTTDGVDIKEGSHLVLYLVNKELNTLLQNVAVINNFSKQDAEVASRYLTFTSEENRDKYIKDNTRKPIFVSADGVEFYNNHKNFLLYSLDKTTLERKRFLIQTCIDYKSYNDNNIHFATEEARQEYIDNNKPRFSLADIEKAYNNTKSPTTSPLFQNFKSELKKLGK